MCPPCKVIIDGNIIIAAARLFAARFSDRAAAAHHLADVTAASLAAIQHGIRGGIFNDAQIDEAHAWSELECHRAAALRTAFTARSSVVRMDISPKGDEISESLLMQWAEETRLHTTKLIGGEYKGAWTVDGINGISKRE